MIPFVIVIVYVVVYIVIGKKRTLVAGSEFVVSWISQKNESEIYEIKINYFQQLHEHYGCILSLSKHRPKSRRSKAFIPSYHHHFLPASKLVSNC